MLCASFDQETRNLNQYVRISLKTNARNHADSTRAPHLETRRPYVIVSTSDLLSGPILTQRSAIVRISTPATPSLHMRNLHPFRRSRGLRTVTARPHPILEGQCLYLLDLVRAAVGRRRRRVGIYTTK